ncbi:non-specific serine/threonine protein kinase [Trifolium repens]|nr:non-specific serine/threonine protein kinase [Trifolium repens]
MDAYTATITFLLFMSLSLPNNAAQTQPQVPKLIAPGSSLSPYTSDHNSMWLSPSGLFAFGFYQPGNNNNNNFVVGIWLVGKINNTVVWTANRNDPPVTSTTKLQFTMNGTIIVTDQQGHEKLIVNANARASSASMLDSGNFVLYGDNSNSRIIWQSFDHPTDTLLGGQSLPCGGQLYSSLSETNSSTGRYHLNMQIDGNLVLYPAYTTETFWDAYWSSDTKAHDGVNVKYHLYLNSTGSLQILNRSSDHGNVINTLNYAEEDQNTGGNQAIYRATVDFDGIFRLHAHYVNNGSDKIIASFPKSSRTCEVKGFCGFNSYCTFDDDKQFCNCLPGYKFIDENEKTLGCERNYSKVECRSYKDGVTFYNMFRMSNIVWKDHPYFKDLTMPTEEECSFACLVDCNCWVVKYESGSCTKQGLPLRYVKRTYEADDSTTSFIKVGNNSIQNSEGHENPFAFPLPIKTTREVNKLVPWEVIDNNVVENMVKAALWCIQDDPFLRPTMKGVVLMLEGITDIQIPPCPNSNST